MKKFAVLIALLLLVPSSVLAQKPGDWVLGKWRGGDFWFPGVVQARNGAEVTISYDDGSQETLPVNLVRDYNWNLGTHVDCRWANGEEWYAGKITGISKDRTQLDILYEDGERERIATGGCRSR